MIKFSASTELSWDIGVDSAHEQVTQSLRHAKKAFNNELYKDAENDLTKAHLFLSQLESAIKFLRDDIRDSMKD